MNDSKLTDWRPTPKQEAFVKVLFGSTTATTIVQACREADVSRQTLYGKWLKDPQFVSYVEECRNRVAWFKLPRVDQAMIDRAEMGDTKAARLVYERFDKLIGRLEVKGEMNINVNGKAELLGRLAGIAARARKDKGSSKPK